jgi:hypothetical protein
MIRIASFGTAALAGLLLVIVAGGNTGLRVAGILMLASGLVGAAVSLRDYRRARGHR